jgi:hypothetical protein
MIIDTDVAAAVKDFLVNYAEVHGLPSPVRNVNRATQSIIFLPAEMGFTSIQRDFFGGLKEDSRLHGLKYDAFRKLWHQLTPYIQIMSPRTDLCDTCQHLRNDLCRNLRDMFWMCWNLICFGWALDRTKKATLTYELVVMPIMYYRFRLYKGRFTDRNRGTIFPNYIFDNLQFKARKEEEARDLLKKYKEHLAKAKLERNYWNKNTKLAEEYRKRVNQNYLLVQDRIPYCSTGGSCPLQL